MEKINRCQCVKNKWWNDKWTKFVASRGQLYAHITTHPHVDDDDSSVFFRWAKKIKFEFFNSNNLMSDPIHKWRNIIFVFTRFKLLNTWTAISIEPSDRE